MPIIDPSHLMSELTVREAMRRLMVTLPQTATLEHAARFFIKYKVNAILITDTPLHGVGVLSKTDLMGAYYADLDFRLPVDSIMASPPLFCRESDSLDSALHAMQQNGIHRLYVLDGDSERSVGVLAYPDIVGLLYRYCNRCERSFRRSWRGRREETGFEKQFTVGDAMSSSVVLHKESDSLLHVMETLSAHRLNAAVIQNEARLPVGVLSKTDLVLAYKHGVPSSTGAGSLMSSPVRVCSRGERLATAIRKMIFADLNRLFVLSDSDDEIVGVLSLYEAAQVRSGSCRACLVSRIRV